MNKYKVHIIWAIIAIVAFGGGMYLGGAQAGGSQASSARGQYGGFSSSTRGSAARGTGGGFVMGSISSVSGNTLNVQLQNGNSEVVFFSSSTQVTKPGSGSISDLVPGTNVSIGGTTNSDGQSVTAQTIQIRTGTMPGSGTRQGGTQSGQ